MEKTPLLHILHVLESISLIEGFVGRQTKAEFLSNRMCFDAVLRNLQTLSESLHKLPEDLKQRYPNIPWRDISGFRNILVHDYLEGVEGRVIWTIARLF